MRIRQKQTYGLALQKNSLTVPDGSTELLVNVLHQRDGLYVKERGFEAIYDPSETIYGCFEFDSFIVVVLNSQIIRIDKFGIAQGSKTSSDEPFEIDGTLRPAPYAFGFAPFSRIMNDQAFFCTPEGVRVMRDSSSNASEMPGLDAPVIVNTADLTKTLDTFIVGEGSYEFLNNSAGTVSTQLPFYTNDLKLELAFKNASPIENADCQADTAISYRAVLRRELSNGQTLESAPSAPVFAYNPLFTDLIWQTDNAGTVFGANLSKNQILINISFRTASTSIPSLSAGDTFTGVIRNAVSIVQNTSGSVIDRVNSPEIDGQHTFEVVATPSTSPVTPVVGQFPPASGNYYESVWVKVTLDIAPKTDFSDPSGAPLGESLGTLDLSLDRFSSLEIEVPSSAETGDYVDLYYSRTEIPLSESPLAVPNGDYYLAKEIEITGAGSPGWTLTTDFSDGIFQKGIPLYTNPSDGDLSRQPNQSPPGANALESWKGHLFYGNTYRRHEVILTHIGGNLLTNRTLSLQFTDSGTPENFTFPFIQADADAPTIKKRVMELAEAITSTSSNFLCYYSNDTTEFPGGLTFISRVPNRAFKVFVNNSDLGNAMEPIVGTSFAATEVQSTQEARRNRVYWSKQNQPEAVPFFVDIGDEDEDILNIRRTRDSLIVVKRDGIFALFGNPSLGTLGVREIDTTVKGISATGVARLGNRVFAKTNQGIVGISDTSMSLVSRNQIEPLVKVSDERSVLDTVMFGFEDDRQLYVATATSPVDSTKIVYSYNTITQSWSELSKVFTWGFVIDNNFTVTKTFQNNRVITDGTQIFIERKDYLLTDFVDETFSFTVSAIDSTNRVLTLSGPFTGPVGSVLSWYSGTATKLYRVTAIDGNDVTLALPFSGSVSDTVVLNTPIESLIRTSPIDGGDSSFVKQFTTFTMNARYDAFSTATLAFRNDWFKNAPEVNWTKQDERRGWGSEQWGKFPWGQATERNLEYRTQPAQIIKTEIPRIIQKSTFLQAEITHNVACEGMFIQQMAFEVDITSKKAAR